MDRKDELRHKILLTVALIALCAIALLIFPRLRGSETPELRWDPVEGGIAITGCSGTPDRLEIPESIDGHQVVAIAAEAFTAQAYIEEVILPDSVTEIGEAAFADCTSLESVEAPGVTVIRMEAFQGCMNLEEISLSQRLAVVEDRAFQSCSRLSALKAPSTLTEIGTDAFAGCGNLYLDVSENALAKEVALQYGISTDGSDTTDGLWLRVIGATLGLGALVLLVWLGISKLRHRGPDKKSETEKR